LSCDAVIVEPLLYPGQLPFRRGDVDRTWVVSGNEFRNEFFGMDSRWWLNKNFLVKSVDEEIKKLVFFDFTVCLLLVFGHIFSKQTF
jgi:hypothetical protein